MAQISKIERILNLVSYLLKARQPVPWRDIVGKVVGYDDGGDPKSLERRFERDKRALKELGLPVRFYPPGAFETEGYLIASEHCFLDPLELLPHEISLLNLLSELGLRRGEKSAELVSALQKLRFDEEPTGLSDPDPGEGDAAAQRSLLRLDHVTDLRGNPTLDAVAEAVLRCQPIRFTYYAVSSGETRERSLDPYGLGFVRGAWYVVGRDHLRNAIRQFRVSRIKGRIELEGEAGAYEVPKGFRVMDHLGAAVWARPEAEAQETTAVTVRIGRDIAWFTGGPVASRSVEEHEDGSATVRFEVVDVPAFLRWLLRHARHVHVLEPAEVRARFVETLEEMAGRHSERPVGVEAP